MHINKNCVHLYNNKMCALLQKVCVFFIQKVCVFFIQKVCILFLTHTNHTSCRVDYKKEDIPFEKNNQISYKLKIGNPSIKCLINLTQHDYNTP